MKWWKKECGGGKKLVDFVSFSIFCASSVILCNSNNTMINKFQWGKFIKKFSLAKIKLNFLFTKSVLMMIVYLLVKKSLSYNAAPKRG
jgi:hypothetical protein